jgi:MATE family multidrug resistance protein
MPALLPTSARIERLATTRGLLALALPMAAGMGVGFLLHFVNRLFLGWDDPEANAFSLPAGMLAWAVQSFFVLSAGYVGTFAAQHHGAGEDDEVGAMCWPALWLGAAACVVSLAMIPLRHRLAALFHFQDPQVAAHMAELLGWYIAETGPIVLMAAMSGFFAGLGRTRLVFMLSAAGCALSILLNHWLIFGGLGVPRLGVGGAGLATLTTSVVFLGVWSALFFAPDVRRRFGTWRNRNADLGRLRRFCRFALPRGGSEILEMGAFLIFSTAVTRLPTTAAAASGIAFSLYLLVLVPFVGLGQGLGIAVGQCMGAGRPDLARRAGWRALAVAAPVLTMIAGLFMLCPRQLLGIYATAEAAADPVRAREWQAIVAAGVPVMACLAIAALGDGVHWVFRMVIVGAGDTRWTLVAMVGTALLTLSLPVWLLLRVADPSLFARWGVTPLTASYVCFAAYSWCIAAVLFLRFRYGPWPTMSVRH